MHFKMAIHLVFATFDAQYCIFVSQHRSFSSHSRPTKKMSIIHLEIQKCGMSQQMRTLLYAFLSQNLAFHVVSSQCQNHSFRRVCSGGRGGICPRLFFTQRMLSDSMKELMLSYKKPLNQMLAENLKNSPLLIWSQCRKVQHFKPSVLLFALLVMVTITLMG